jgi:hypothetical protein
MRMMPMVASMAAGPFCSDRSDNEGSPPLFPSGQGRPPPQGSDQTIASL